MSWFGRKKNKDAPEFVESASQEQGAEVGEAGVGTENPASVEIPRREVVLPEGNILDYVESTNELAVIDTGEFRALSTYENSADGYSPQFSETEEEPPLTGGLAPVVVTEASREERVQDSLERWRMSLEDLTSESDFLTDMRGGAHLDLTQSHPQGLAHLFAAWGSTKLSSLVREEESLAQAREKAREIRHIALVNAEDRGLTTCHLGIGEATWTDVTGRNIHAPVLLRPITLSISGSAREDVNLGLDAAVELNPIVLRALREEGVLIDSRALLELTDSHHGFDPQPVLNAFRSLGEPLPNFRVSHGLVVGNVVDATGPMLDDFNAPIAELSAKPLIGALAGDPESIAQIQAEESSISPDQITVVAAPDPDAQRMSAALDERTVLAVHTAPGSSSADQVVAFVTEQIAAGKRVLLLSQRASRLAELAHGISRAGLDDLVLSLRPDPHVQREASKSLVLSLAKASSFISPVPLGEPEGLDETRAVLTGHVEAMHRVQEPWGVSAHEAINALAALSRLRHTPKTSVRLTPHVAGLVKDDRERYKGMFTRALETGALSMKAGDSAWFGASITTKTQAERALSLVRELDEGLLPGVARQASEYGEKCGLREAKTFAEFRHVVRVLQSMRAVFVHVRPQVFSEDIPAMIAALSSKQERQEKGISQGFGERRRLKKLAKEMLQSSADPENTLEFLNEAEKARQHWNAVKLGSAHTPVVPHTLPEAAALVGAMQKSLDELSVLLNGTPEGKDLENTELVALHARVRELVKDHEILEVLPERTSIVRELEFEGFGALVADLREREVRGETVLHELELSWWVSVLEFIARAEPTLSQYDGTKLSQVAERYRKLDDEYMKNGRYRVRQKADDLLVETMKLFPDTSRAAIMELNGGSTMSIRETAAKYQDIVFRARPLWIASPYTVSQMIPAGEHFDLVVIADASRLPTAAAIGAIARAKHAVVIGDPFEYAHDDDSRVGHRTLLLDDVSAFAPILRMTHDSHPATGGVRRFVGERAVRTHADWAHIQAPPSPEQVDDDAFVYVPDGRGPVLHGAEFVESTEAELRRVSDLVIYHARHTPERSLAVVTLTESHAEKLHEYIMHSVRVLPDLREFFTMDGEEYFTVQSIDEAGTLVRDDVIVSLGFGLTPHNRLLHRFGPLSTSSGRQALVTLLTRARYRTSLVSAVRSADLEPSRLRTEGAADLRELLEFVESGFDADVIERFAEEHRAAGLEEATSSEGEGSESDAVASEASQDLPEAETGDGESADAGEESEEAHVEEPASEDGGDAGEPASAVEDSEDAGAVSEPEGESAPETEPAPESESEAETENDAELDTLEHDSSGALVRDLADRLWRMGYTVTLDYGLSAHTVELAIAHPGAPGRYLVAVATDGRRYRETADQRERDRLWAERLEKAGWAVERVWSWALFIDPAGEAERVKKTVDLAYQHYLEVMDEKLGRGTSRHRLPKPKVPAGHPLSFYGPEDFDAVVAYICSDGKARLPEQLAADVRDFLAFDQRSVLLDVSVSSAIRRYQEAQEAGDAR